MDHIINLIVYVADPDNKTVVGAGVACVSVIAYLAGMIYVPIIFGGLGYLFFKSTQQHKAQISGRNGLSVQTTTQNNELEGSSVVTTGLGESGAAGLGGLRTSGKITTTTSVQSKVEGLGGLGTSVSPTGLGGISAAPVGLGGLGGSVSASHALSGAVDVYLGSQDVELYELYDIEGSISATLIQIAARYCGAVLTINNDLQSVSGNAPVLKTNEGLLVGTNAILRYIAREYSDHFYGETEFERAQADSWLEWLQINVVHPAERYLLPVEKIGNVDYFSMKDASEEILLQLEELNVHLQKNTFISGRYVTLVDISAALCISELFTEVYGKKQSSKLSSINRWINTVLEQPIVLLYNDPSKFSPRKTSAIPPVPPKN